MTQNSAVELLKIKIKFMFGKMFTKKMAADKTEISDLHFTIIFCGTW